MYKYSEYGIKNKDVFCRIYADFIDWCKNKYKSGIFSTYIDGEPVFYSMGTDISYTQYKRLTNSPYK